MRRRLILIAALLLLNLSLTFENLWPTPAIVWRGGISIELAVVVALLAIVAIARGRVPAPLARGASVLWMVLTLGRYAEVTSPALYGRDVNLYWDLRFIPDVVHMVTRVAPIWLVAVSTAAIVVLLAALYFIFRWAFGRIGAEMSDAAARRALMPVAILLIVIFAARAAGLPTGRAFTEPVTATYARQITFVFEATRGSKTLAASPAMDSDFSRIKGADVFVVFVEAYGAIGYQRPEIAMPLEAARQRFAADVNESGRSVISAYAKSPTFGGSSWLAHISLMSGIEVRDPDTNAKLMTEQRDTLARAFGRRGFRTVALMPGLRQSWPEGRFYGFDEIYGADRLDYWGPEFGWFAIPDQFALARLDELEMRKSPRPPLFVFFPTISTHFPFHPTPPYQPDWSRMTTRTPYDGPDIVRAYSRQPDWTDFGPGYIDAIAYDFASIGGFLRKEADRDLVVVMLGDHQPAAAVSGEGAPWDVPVHIIASPGTRAAVLDRLRRRGFVDGLVPRSPALGGIHELLPLLLDAFGDKATAEHAEHAEKE